MSDAVGSVAPRRHRCHARGCEVEVPPRLLLCRRHWRMAPPSLQRALWREYRLGQEITKTPTRSCVEAALAAGDAVARAEERHDG